MSLNAERKSKLMKDLSAFGYGVLEGVLAPDECAKLIRHLDVIEAERRDRKDIYIDPQRVMLWNIHQSHPDIFLDKISNPDVDVKTLHATFLSASVIQSAAGLQMTPPQQFSIRYPTSPFIAA